MVTTLLLVGLALAAPPYDVRPTLESLAARPDAEWAQVRAEALQEVDPASLDAVTGDRDWEVGLTAQSLRAWHDQPALAERTWTTRPGKRRDGAMVFRGEGLPEVIGERLQHGGEPVDVRLALVDWLRRSTTAWPSWADSAFGDEPDARVRAAWIDAARYLGAPSRREAGADGRAIVLAGFGDADARVRAASARIAAYLDAPELVPALIHATADGSDEVAGLAARSLGVLRAGGAYEAVRELLGRSDAKARLRAVRALQRLDGARAHADPRIAALTDDADPRVARAAGEVTAD